MTLVEYLLAANDPKAKPQGWRQGQWAFNLLCEVKPEIAEQVRGTEYDPFYREAGLIKFFEYVASHWEYAS